MPPNPLDGIALVGHETEGASTILCPEALSFVAGLVRRHRPALQALFDRRVEDQARYDAGVLPDFQLETQSIREGDWRVDPLPSGLLDRRVEITGPVDRKMVINALNSGASCFMADFEDATSPTWENLVEGQKNLYDAVRRTISYLDGRTGKTYVLTGSPAVLLVRPRGLHLPEKHLVVDGQAVPGCLFDFGLFFFHNAREQVARGAGPWFYLPKLQHGREAAWWDEVFVDAQRQLGLPVGTIKATVLLETLPAAFQMHEILHALRHHAAGLNCGRWDYIFSYIKTLRAHPDRLLPDRAQVGMTQPFLRAYTELVIQTCHRRGAPAMGGMAAQIPVKDDPVKNAEAMARVRADKEREVRAGHDGTWVAHPGLVPLAREVFDAGMPTPNQLFVMRDDVCADATLLLAAPPGTCTAEGLRANVRIGIEYLAAWLSGNGCVPLHGLMEDAATAEISRAQVWQQVRHGARLVDGRTVTAELVAALVSEALTEIDRPKAREAGGLFLELATADQCPDFLTLPAYERLS